MSYFVGLDVSEKTTVICVLDTREARTWRGQCDTVPDEIAQSVHHHAGEDLRIGIETGAMTHCLVHELRGQGLDIVYLDAQYARAALRMQINQTDQNDAE